MRNLNKFMNNLKTAKNNHLHLVLGFYDNYSLDNSIKFAFLIKLKRSERMNELLALTHVVLLSQEVNRWLGHLIQPG